MNQGLISKSCHLSIITPRYHSRSFKSFNSSNALNASSSPRFFVRHSRPRRLIFCSQSNSWEPTPVTYAPVDEAGGSFLERTSNIFENLNSDSMTEVQTEEVTEVNNQSDVQLQFLKWPMWLLGPSILLITGMAPTLWLPLSSVFLGPNIASLLSLIGLDCIYNLGATLFLLMADACARPKRPIKATMNHSATAPSDYQFWNMFANVIGLVIPLIMIYGSKKGLLQPPLPFISFAVLLGPYNLLLSVQILTEMLTWHWQSPVWLVTPVVYETYRVLQLIRGLNLAAEVNAPVWMMHTIRGLVSWWVLILGIQLMRVAWFAGLVSGSHKQENVTNSL